MQSYQKAEKLVLKGNSNFVRWFPGHSGIEKNEIADNDAKEVTMREKVRTAR